MRKDFKPFWAEYSPEYYKNKPHRRKINSRFRVTGESIDGKCWRGYWEGSKTPYTYSKNFLTKIENNENTNDEPNPDDLPERLFSGPNL